MTNYMTYIYFICVIQNMYNLTKEAIVKHCKYILRLSLTWSGHHAIKIAIHKNFIIFFETYLH